MSINIGEIGFPLPCQWVWGMGWGAMPEGKGLGRGVYMHTRVHTYAHTHVSGGSCPQEKAKGWKIKVISQAIQLEGLSMCGI